MKTEHFFKVVSSDSYKGDINKRTFTIEASRGSEAFRTLIANLKAEDLRQLAEAAFQVVEYDHYLKGGNTEIDPADVSAFFPY